MGTHAYGDGVVGERSISPTYHDALKTIVFKAASSS